MDCPEQMGEQLRQYGVIWSLIFDLKQSMQLVNCEARTQRIQFIFNRLNWCGQQKFNECLNNLYTAKIILGAQFKEEDEITLKELNSLKNNINELKGFYCNKPPAYNFYSSIVFANQRLSQFLDETHTDSICTVKGIQKLAKSISAVNLQNFQHESRVAGQFFNKKEKLIFISLLNCRTRSNNLLNTIKAHCEVIELSNLSQVCEGELNREQDGESIDYSLLALKMGNVLAAKNLASNKHVILLCLFIEVIFFVGKQFEVKRELMLNAVSHTISSQDDNKKEFRNKLNNFLLSQPSANSNVMNVNRKQF